MTDRKLSDVWWMTADLIPVTSCEPPEGTTCYLQRGSTSYAAADAKRHAFDNPGHLVVRESCGSHFREEFQEDGECKRDDANFAHVAAWEYAGRDKKPGRNIELLLYQEIQMSTRSYK